ncbi:HU family DNA-binding protein [Ferrimonas pelagia]|uniref:HU family DNA-binding protein n=2 Tax=Ferrimonas pelagia TaxID=1177826 RepID=A0ABP9F3A5_9GAMM
MTRTELIKLIATQADLTQTTSKAVLDTLQRVICQALHEGETVYLPRLGVFEVRHHLPRTGRHPQTGEAIEIPFKTVAAFKPATPLKHAVNQG